MSRPKSTNPTRFIRAYVNATLAARIELLLFSEAEGKVPFGAWQEFFNERMRDFLESKSLDLATIAPATSQLPPSTFFIRGSEESLSILKEIVK